MPTFLSDPSTALYVVLAVAVLVTGVLAAKRQRRTDLINFAIPAAALLAVFVIDQMYESPRETVARNLKEMEAASQGRRYDDLFRHVSEKFQYKSLDKKGLREKARAVEGLTEFEGLKIVNLGRQGFVQKDPTTVEQTFDVMPLRTVGNEYRYECTATFKDEGGMWRLVGVVFRQNGQEVTPPGL